MNEILYSFIIPHHNNPKLLSRLLDTIPQRADIEIIVVDDNSKPELVPSISRNDVSLVCIKAEDSKWAGHARNIGLKKSQGKYILFADDDDFFKDNFLEVLDKYTKSDYQVIYFGCESVDSQTLKPAGRTTKRERLIKDYKNGNVDGFKYLIRVPWGKAILREWVIENNFQFEEIEKGNDMQFTFLTNYFAENVKLIDDVLYVCTYRCDSMTFQKRSLGSYITSLKNYHKLNGFYTYIGHPEWKMSIGRVFVRFLNNTSLKNNIMIVLCYLNNYSSFKQLENYYKCIIERVGEATKS